MYGNTLQIQNLGLTSIKEKCMQHKKLKHM